ncbi:hypothetical protein [Clostridium aminobutyricum]|uniref:Uncharacterized protein n=1 Tax=Clostridium aminobutyricum TaxID=33953 RepID=A0A939D8Y6_CLOAM|nr:hypothetical protein [Clostridium aminobutyricum]MBN7773310.1 hypothetical protein [Clostridium aminobutyricum]
MSLFLGKIHYWLYNKIIWAEKAEEEIIQWAKTNGLPVEQWVQQGIETYGKPTGNEVLEEVIDTSNIHGWLQERIKSAELRQAALITHIIAEKENYKEDLIQIFKAQGKEAALAYTEQPDTPEGLYNAVHDFVLEGMPCDRASAVLSNDPNEISWEITTCLHAPYWEQVQGDVKNFYDLREAWVSSFIETLNSHFKYSKSTDGTHRIIRS